MSQHVGWTGLSVLLENFAGERPANGDLDPDSGALARVGLHFEELRGIEAAELVVSRNELIDLIFSGNPADLLFSTGGQNTDGICIVGIVWIRFEFNQAVIGSIFDRSEERRVGKECA